jgi:putative transcriptional regulator
LGVQGKTRRRVLDAVHQTAADLQRLGFIEKRKFDALRLPPIPSYEGEQIKALRERVKPNKSVL